MVGDPHILVVGFRFPNTAFPCLCLGYLNFTSKTNVLKTNPLTWYTGVLFSVNLKQCTYEVCGLYNDSEIGLEWLCCSVNYMSSYLRTLHTCKFCYVLTFVLFHFGSSILDLKMAFIFPLVPSLPKNVECVLGGGVVCVNVA